MSKKDVGDLTNPNPDETKESGKEQDEKSYFHDGDSRYHYVPYGITSFKEYEEYLVAEEMARDTISATKAFLAITENIVFADADDVPNKEAALTKLNKEFSRRTNESVPVTERLKSRVASMRDRLMETSRSAIEYKYSAAVEPKPQITFWKEADGTTRFLSVHTNNFRDNDNPPEIIAAVAHEKFVDRVESGELPYPALWHWHIPGTHWGNVDFLHYDKDTGFMLSSGYVLPGHEDEAEAVSNMGYVAMSHGMPADSIVYDDKDSSVIVEYQSIEISDLPPLYAANKQTAFAVLKEQDMSIPNIKREFLQNVGYSEEQLDVIEDALATQKATADEAGIESKENNGEPNAKSQDAPDKTENSKVPEKAPAYKSDDLQYVTATEVAEVIAPLVEAIGVLTATVKELQTSDVERMKTLKSETPAASLVDLIKERTYASAIGNIDTRIDGRSSLARSKPKEEESDSYRESTGIPFLDHVVRLNDRDREAVQLQ